MKNKTYTQIINELLIKGYYLSAKCIIKHTKCNNPFEVIRKIRAKHGKDYIKTEMVTNKLTGKKFAVYSLNK